MNWKRPIIGWQCLWVHLQRSDSNACCCCCGPCAMMPEGLQAQLHPPLSTAEPLTKQQLVPVQSLQATQLGSCPLMEAALRADPICACVEVPQTSVVTICMASGVSELP